MKNLEALSGLQQSMVRLLKDGRWTLSEMAKRLKVTFEAVRQQAQALQLEGWITKSLERGRGAGRPQSRYALTEAGEHLFPKSYDELTVELIDHMSEKLGPQAVRKVLESFTDARVEKWEKRMKGKSLPERLKALQDIYQQDDPYTSVEKSKDGYRLVEKNCPFLSVASRRPLLCSVTVSALSRLLGVKVVREEKFQEGHGRCVFRVLEKEPLPRGGSNFRPEPT